MRRGRADPGEAECLGDRRDDRYGPICRDGQHPVDADPARDLEDGVDVREVDDLCDVRGHEAGCIAVTVDRSDMKAASPRLVDRPTLMSSGADKEDRCHGRRW
jgi:hypothetical protein